MKQTTIIKEDLSDIKTVNNLTGVFESIASIRVAQIKNQVLASKEFFSSLWDLYANLRVDPTLRINSNRNVASGKDLFIIITAEGGLSGDIDEKLVQWMLTKYDSDQADIIALGHHGVLQLAQQDVKIKKYYKLPSKEDIDVSPIVEEVLDYANTTVFYQTYVSLAIQDVSSMNLQTAVQNLSAEVEAEQLSSEIITPKNYIFEPSTEEVIDYLESVMLGIALRQAIFESKLAQHASRYNAMSAAHRKAEDMQDDLELTYNRAKRSEEDERLKEVIAGMKQAQKGGTL